MATSINFNQSYTGSQLSSGLYSDTLAQPSYTGTSLGAIGASYAVSGTVSGTGSTVTVVRTTVIGTVSSTATYEGYFSNTSGTYYVFADPTLFGTGGAFAISATGATVSLNALTTLTTGLPSAVCFLAGTRILTAAGEVSIESISIGDLVAVRRNGATAFEPVRWVGRGAGHVTPGDTAIDDAPVRIAADAIAANVPDRDLLVTPEHCLLLDGVLIPARMLVNGSSITSETGLDTFAYFHIELDAHAILLANNTEAESYLDTGNRSNFRNSATVALKPNFSAPEVRRWSTDAAAPLATDRTIVEPIWTRLAKRAHTLGFTTSPVVSAEAKETDLRIVTAGGREILPTLTDGRVYAFVVPPGSGALRLRSHSARPSDVVGPFLDDRRVLGVQIGHIGIASGHGRGTDDMHLKAGPLAGWHEVEGNGTCRWTDGNALLPLESTNDGDTLFLDIEVLGVGPYHTTAKAA